MVALLTWLPMPPAAALKLIVTELLAGSVTVPLNCVPDVVCVVSVPELEPVAELTLLARLLS